EEILYAAIEIGAGVVEGGPLTGEFSLEDDADVGGGLAAGGVEDVGGDAAHAGVGVERSFSRRRRVIIACSRAAVASSVSGSLVRRARRASSISAADLPVAQMRKMWPKRCSYCWLPVMKSARCWGVAAAMPDCSLAVWLEGVRLRSPIRGWREKASSQSAWERANQ